MLTLVVWCVHGVKLCAWVCPVYACVLYVCEVCDVCVHVVWSIVEVYHECYTKSLSLLCISNKPLDHVR